MNKSEASGLALVNRQQKAVFLESLKPPVKLLLKGICGIIGMVPVQLDLSQSGVHQFPQPLQFILAHKVKRIEPCVLRRHPVNITVPDGKLWILGQPFG